MEQFKARFAEAAARENVDELKGLLIEGEDLLVHVCGQQRYEEIKRAAEEIPPSPVFKRMFDGPMKVLARQEAIDSLKRRIVGIEYRK